MKEGARDGNLPPPSTTLLLTPFFTWSVTLIPHSLLMGGKELAVVESQLSLRAGSKDFPRLLPM